MRTSPRFAALFTLAGVLTFIGAASAEPYPARPITLVVPYAAGGPADTIARIVAERMRAALGQTIVIENVTGAGGSIGAGRVARSAPDGYTLVIGNWSTHVANGILYSLSYDLVDDFAPISLLASEPDLIITRKAMPASDLKELIGWLKGNATSATGGTSGVGGPSHVAAILFQKETGTRFQLIPYRGAGPAMQDLLGERLDVMISGPSVALPYLQAGKIKAYAVTTGHRIAAAPDVPTTDEMGLPNFHVDVWQALWAPKDTPQDVVARLAAAAHAALADPDVRQRLAGLALDIPSEPRQGPEALRAYQKAEIDKWWPVIKAANIKGE
jgi:tripartite-type tricarboxylate transporter receptor subunit TctC